MAKRSVEPIPWLLFSAGGVASAMFLPVLLLLFGLVFPLGWISPPSYDDIAGLLGNWLTRLVLLGVFAVSLFHWAHRFRFTLYDGLQLKHLSRQIALLCYGGAAFGSLASAYLLLQLP
jgi:fumarate reductase subunit D